MSNHEDDRHPRHFDSQNHEDACQNHEDDGSTIFKEPYYCTTIKW